MKPGVARRNPWNQFQKPTQPWKGDRKEIALPSFKDRTAYTGALDANALSPYGRPCGAAEMTLRVSTPGVPRGWRRVSPLANHGRRSAAASRFPIDRMIRLQTEGSVPECAALEGRPVVSQG